MSQAISSSLRTSADQKLSSTAPTEPSSIPIAIEAIQELGTQFKRENLPDQPSGTSVHKRMRITEPDRMDGESDAPVAIMVESRRQIWDSSKIATSLWQNPITIVTDKMVEKVNAVADYLRDIGFELRGIKADGNCFIHAFLKSYETLSRKIPLLDIQENKISFLRNTLSAQYERTFRGSTRDGIDRSQDIKKDGEWITASEEGDLLAYALSIPIRVITVNRDQSGCGISDMLTFPDANKPRQEWSTILKGERPEEYVFIVDLGGHFIFAEKAQNKPTPVLPLSPLKDFSILPSAIPSSIIKGEPSSLTAGEHRRKRNINSPQEQQRENTTRSTGLAERPERTFFTLPIDPNAVTSQENNRIEDLSPIDLTGDRSKIEDEVMKAIAEGRVGDLRRLVSQLEGGVNTRLEHGCNLLMYAIDENSVICAKALLEMGARLEDHEREYTPLFTAAENGNLAMVKLLLKSGSNMTGEFYFNTENALSISAFKFCRAFQFFLEQHFNQFSPSDQKEVPEMQDWWSKIWKFSATPPWNLFFEKDSLGYATSCLIFLRENRKLLDLENDDLSIKIDRLAVIFSLIRDKYLVLREKAKPSEKDDYSTDEEEDLQLVYKIDPIVLPTDRFQNLTKEQLEEHIGRLNQELREGKIESDINWSNYPRFFIAQYRGIHYYRSYFSKGQRADHRSTSHLNRIAPAIAT